MSLLDKLKKNSKIEGADILSDSNLYSTKDVCQTSVPMINVALSGSIDGGLTSGLTVLAGPSKHFKTSFGLLMAAAYLKKHEDAVLLFYDSEFGSPQAYFEAFDIDTDRKKELEDALSEKSVADMTRAKALKGLFRMVTPYLTMKNVPLLAINHTYQEIGLFPKAVVSGGTGIMYSADNVWIIGRQQEKEGTEIKGYHFVINVEKSRFVKEKSKIPISVTWEGGIAQWSGLTDVALDLGYVKKPKVGWYQAVNPKTDEELTGNKRMKDTLTKEFWEDVFEKTDFAKAIKEHYSVGHVSMISGDNDDTD